MENELLNVVGSVRKDLLFIKLIASVEIPMIAKMNKTNYDKLINLKYTGVDKEKTDILNINILDNKEVLDELFYKLKDYTKKSNMKNAYKNIKNVELNKQAIIYVLGWKGSYNVKNNEIKYVGRDAISHEFLHMSSAFYDKEKNITYDGFLVSNKKDGKAGQGLNEGYTELLASRIYRNGKVKAYKKEVNVASILEKFFYNEKDMEDYYFNHDLPGFIYYMSQYASKEEVKKLINDIDLITGTNSMLSSSPSYYYLKVLNRLNKLSNSNNLEPSRQKKIKEMINSNLIMKSINKSSELISNKTLLIK